MKVLENMNVAPRAYRVHFDLAHSQVMKCVTCRLMENHIILEPVEKVRSGVAARRGIWRRRLRTRFSVLGRVVCPQQAMSSGKLSAEKSGEDSGRDPNGVACLEGCVEQVILLNTERRD